MNDDRRRFALERSFIVAAAVTTAIICILSYLADPSCGQLFNVGDRFDLLAPNLTERWSVFGALSANEIRLSQIEDGIVQIEVPADAPSWSGVSSGVIYTIGLFSPGWYEFTGEFRAEANEGAGIGAQLEVHSRLWRFVSKTDPGREAGWKKLDVYFRPCYSDPAADISCRFWSVVGGRSGKVFLRNMRLVKIAAAPPLGAAQFDLERKEEARLGKPGLRGNAGYGGIAVVMLLLGITVGVSWRLLE